MKIKIIETSYFSKQVSGLLKKRQLIKDDFDAFLHELAEKPDAGDIIQGSGGVRKVRLKSASRGKSGGFRVCYYHITEDGEIYLLFIYPKNVQENLSMEQRKELKVIVKSIRGKNNDKK